MMKSEKTISKKVVSGYSSPTVESSYRENNLGKTLYDLVIKEKPKTIVEFGTLNGYSAIAMAQACRDNKVGHIVSYDLWDEYKHKHGTRALVQEEIDKLGLSNFITLEKGDFKHWQGDADLIVLDISNDGSTIIEADKKFRGHCKQFVFEGGTVERDRVKWMLKYNRPAIVSCGVRYEVLDERFPSLSVIDYEKRK